MRKRSPNLLAVVTTSSMIVASTLAGELRALCSAAKDLVSAAKAQEGVLITYPTPTEFSASTIAYAAAKKRYIAELRSVRPIIIAIGLKQRPENAELEEVSVSLPGIWRERGGTGSQSDAWNVEAI